MINETKLLIAKAALEQVVSILQKVVANLEGIDSLPSSATTLKSDAETLLASVISAHSAI